MSRPSGSDPRPRDKEQLHIGDMSARTPANYRSRPGSGPSSRRNCGRPVCSRAADTHGRFGLLPNLPPTSRAAWRHDANRITERIVVGRSCARLSLVLLGYFSESATSEVGVATGRLDRLTRVRFFGAPLCSRFIVRKDCGRSFSSYSTPDATRPRAVFSRGALLPAIPFLPLRGLLVRQIRRIGRDRQACDDEEGRSDDRPSRSDVVAQAIRTFSA